MEQVINAERIEQVISVFGSFDENIKKIEEAFQVRVVNRGTELKVSGDDEPVLQAARAIELLLELADTISATALCGLGKSAASPVVSTIKGFREEYEAHIYEKRCPAGACQKLKRISIDPALCKGCSKCSRICPVGAISGKIKQPFVIDGEKCIKCGACLESCPFHAIKEA